MTYNTKGGGRWALWQCEIIVRTRSGSTAAQSTTVRMICARWLTAKSELRGHFGLWRYCAKRGGARLDHDHRMGTRFGAPRLVEPMAKNGHFNAKISRASVP